MFNAGFELERVKTFSFRNNVMKLTDEKIVNNGDTSSTQIEIPDFLFWDRKSTGKLKKTIYSNGNPLLLTDQQDGITDTIILNKPAKVFRKTISISPQDNPDTLLLSWPYMIIYGSNMGMFYTQYNHPNSKQTWELAEQMAWHDFKILSNHNRKRIGYIDPKETIDQNSGFTLCGNHSRVFDYYNSHPHVTFSEGKRALMHHVISKLDENKIQHESGYLTFRFIVNCKGQAGWFTTEQANLNFEEKKFNQKTIGHLFEITSSLSTWNPIIVDENPHDAYFYLTYKLVDGKLIDILP